MKLKHAILSFTMASVMGLGVALSLGGNKVEEAKAEHPIPVANSGKIYLQMNTDTWKSSESKVGLYMFDDNAHDAWGDLVTPSGTSRFVEYSYSLDFTPTKCIAFRVSSSAAVLNEWVWNYHAADLYARTYNIDFNHVVWLGNYHTDSKYTDSGSYELDAVVKGGASDDWSVATVDAQLTDVKVNSSDNLEVYGKVSLPANTYFKILKLGGKEGQVWCGDYNADDLIKSNLSTSSSGNIHNEKAATYEFYFDYDGKTTWITDPDLAEADEYAQSFNSALYAVCSGDHDAEGYKASLQAAWGLQATAFGGLSDGAKEILSTAKAKTGEGATFVEQFAAKYDGIIEKYGDTDFPDFADRFESSVDGWYKGSTTVLNVNDNNNTLMIVIIISAVSVASLAALLIIKKRKHN